MRKALISQGFSVRHLNRPQHLVGEDGFEPSKRNAADLQSVPFGHSGTPPYLVVSQRLGYYSMDFGFVKGVSEEKWSIADAIWSVLRTWSKAHLFENSFFMMRSIASCAQLASCAVRCASLKKSACFASGFFLVGEDGFVCIFIPFGEWK